MSDEAVQCAAERIGGETPRFVRPSQSLSHGTRTFPHTAADASRLDRRMTSPQRRGRDQPETDGKGAAPERD